MGSFTNASFSRQSSRRALDSSSDEVGSLYHKVGVTASLASGGCAGGILKPPLRLAGHTRAAEGGQGRQAGTSCLPSGAAAVGRAEGGTLQPLFLYGQAAPQAVLSASRPGRNCFKR